MHEQGRQRRVDAVSNEPSHATGVITLPDGIRRENDIGRPTRDGAGRQKDRVANRLVPATPPVKHSRQHRHVEIGVVVDTHLALAVVETMQSAGILRDGSSPGYGKRQKQRVQPGIVESLANVLASREYDSPFVARDSCETLIDCVPLLLAHAGAQDDNVIDARREFLFEAVEMVIALCQYQRRPPIANGIDHVLANSPRPRQVIGQLLVQSLKFDALVWIRISVRLKRCRLNEHEVFEWAGCRLSASIYLMSNRAALHEDDWMVTILACDSCRQTKDESVLRLPCYLFETMRREMVAFVDDHVAVIRHDVGDHALADETLHDADIDPPSRSTSA